MVNSDIRVSKILVGGSTQVLIEGGDYTLTGGGTYAGGIIVLATALAAGEILEVLRDVPFTQPTDLRNQGGVFPETIEVMVDRLTMIVQQLKNSLISFQQGNNDYYSSPTFIGISLDASAPVSVDRDITGQSPFRSNNNFLYYAKFTASADVNFTVQILEGSTIRYEFPHIQQAAEDSPFTLHFSQSNATLTLRIIKHSGGAATVTLEFCGMELV